MTHPTRTHPIKLANPAALRRALRESAGRGPSARRVLATGKVVIKGGKAQIIAPISPTLARLERAAMKWSHAGPHYWPTGATQQLLRACIAHAAAKAKGRKSERKGCK